MSCRKGYSRVVHCIATSHCDILRPSASICVYLTRKVRLMNTTSSDPGGLARCRFNSRAAKLQSSSAASRISKIPTTAPFSSLGPALLQMMYSYYGVFAWKASHSQHYNHTPELSRSRGQHRCNTRLGGWTQINIKERNRVLLCASA